MYSVELKIKRVNLADEARKIRIEEKRAKAAGKRSLVDSLHNHRCYNVRMAARGAHLAHTYLRGQAYAVAERTTRTMPSMEDIAKNLLAFGRFNYDKKSMMKLVEAWTQGAAPVGTRDSNPEVAGSTPASTA